MRNVGLIGLGAMGLPIAGRMVAGGLRVYAHDVKSAAMEGAQDIGAIVADDIAIITAQCDLVLVSMGTEQALTEVVSELLAHLPAESTVVDIGTTSVATTRMLAAQAAAVGVGYVDAPVSGSVPWAQQGRLTAMVGGAQRDYERCRPVIETFARQIFYLGESGSGQTVKLCHQLVFFSLMCGLSEGLAMAAQEGLSRDGVLAAIDACVAPNHVMEFMLPAVASGSFTGADIKIASKDMGAIMDLARGAGFEAPVAAQVNEYFRSFVSRNLVDYNLFGILDLVARDGFGERHTPAEGE